MQNRQENSACRLLRGRDIGGAEFHGLVDLLAPAGDEGGHGAEQCHNSDLLGFHGTTSNCRLHARVSPTLGADPSCQGPRGTPFCGQSVYCHSH